MVRLSRGCCSSYYVYRIPTSIILFVFFFLALLHHRHTICIITTTAAVAFIDIIPHLYLLYVLQTCPSSFLRFCSFHSIISFVRSLCFIDHRINWGPKFASLFSLFCVDANGYKSVTNANCERARIVMYYANVITGAYMDCIQCIQNIRYVMFVRVSV